MSNFFRSLFGAKKAAKIVQVAKSKMQTRKLELIGLEERITPAVVSNAAGILTVTLGVAESITNLNASYVGANLVINTVGATSATVVTGVTYSNAGATITVDPTFNGGNGILGLAVAGNTGTENVTIGGAVDLSGSATVGSFNVASSVETLAVNAAVTAKGTVAATSGVTLAATTAINIGAAGDIVTTAGNVAITGVIQTAGDVTTTSGAIGYTGAVTLSGNVATTSTLAGADLSFSSSLTLSTFNFTASQGLGKASVTGAITGTGNLSITSTNATVSPTGSAISLAAVSAGAVSLTGAGDVSVSGVVSATSVNAKSTAGDVVFGNTVGTSAVGGFVSEATLATKATKIGAAVNVGAGANATVTGNLVSNTSSASVGINTTSGAILVTGKVDASIAANSLGLATTSGGNITVSGAIGSSATAMGNLILDTSGTILLSSTVIAADILVGTNVVPSTSSVTFADAVKSTGVNGLGVATAGNGTISFAKTIELTNAAADIGLSSANGNITVTGVITGKDNVNITTSGSGAITLSAAISNDSVGGDIIIQSGTGNVVTSGAISTSGATAVISIDTATSGNVTVNGNVSTSGGGDIFLGADSVTVARGTGNLTINGTVTTTGTAAGDIVFGIAGGTGTVNKAVTAGATGDVYFINNLATDAYTIVSGANISAGNAVIDAFTSGGAAGIINLGANITALNDTGAVLTFRGIALDNSINLTGAVSMKAAGTSGDINLANVNGAQNLTLEATDQIVFNTGAGITGVGATTALNTVTVTNSAGVTVSGNFNASVVLTDTTGAVAFNGTNTTISKLTTFVKGYSVAFGNNSTDTTVLSGAPVFLNTGGVNFGGTTSLITGATITGNATSTVDLIGTIVSGGAFNIGAAGNTGVVSIADGTQLILNSAVASTIANPIVINGGSAGTLSLLGTGTLTLSADSLTGTTGDSISVINGTLNVTGKIANATTATSGTITGAGGTIGNLSVNTGTVAPGGTLKTGAVSLNAATNYKAAVLTATTASNLETASSINLGSATLSLSSVAAGLAVNNTFTIINNTATSGLVTGTFANQPEGSSISAKDTAGNTVAFTVSYIGGTNANDVTLKVTSITPSTPTPTAPAQPMVAGQPALNKFTAVGADAGGGPLVTITFQNGTFVSFFAYASTFTGGVRVALGDVNGDGSTDVITGAGPGGGPQVNVYNVNNATGAVSLQKSFFAFNAPSFTGGVYVAAGNTNADAFADVIVGAGATGGSRVQVYAGSATGVVTTSTLNDFFAYSPAFTGGVVVAAGQRDAVAGDEVITAPASNGGYNIKSFNVNGKGNSPTVVDNFFAFNNTTSVGGLSLAVGLLNSGSISDLIVGTSNGGYGVIVDSATSGILGVPFAGFTGAIRAGVAEDATGQDFAVALAGPTGAPRVSVFSVGATSLTQTDSLFVMNTGFTGGLFGTPSLPETIVVV